jgi:integrative and conjugative element protein (TIGR02256 family)
MVRNRQMTIRDSEAGGQLFAKFDGSKTIVVEATGPKPLDKRSRFGFIPSRWLERLEIRAQYKMGKHFVGDWHTHPQPIPSPSSEDISSMIDCFSKSHHELKAFLMVIVGTANLPEGILVCVVDTHGVKPLEHQP